MEHMVASKFDPATGKYNVSAIFVGHVTDLYNYKLMLTNEQLNELKEAAHANNSGKHTITLTEEQSAAWKQAALLQEIDTMELDEIELTAEQIEQLKVVYDKWKNVKTIEHKSFWNVFFNDCQGYTVEDLFVLSKYFNLDKVFDDDSGLAVEHWQKMIEDMDGTEVLSWVALERELLAIGDQRAISGTVFMVTSGQL